MDETKLLDRVINDSVEQDLDLIFKQYKLYVEMANNISNRRALANNFFLTANTALLVVIGIIFQNHLLNLLNPVAFIGVSLSLFWCYLIYQYKKLNWAKFQVINSLEEKLPVRGFTVEWDLLEQGKRPWIFWPFTNIEILLPIFTTIFYSIIILYSILSLLNSIY